METSILKMSEPTRNQEWWDRWFIGMAQYVSSASKDPSTKTGAIIVDQNKRVVSVGYNGFPKKVHDKEERYSNRELKYKMVVHCETNAILFANRDISDCTLYTWPFMSCCRCSTNVIQSGIRRCVAPFTNNKRLIDTFELALACQMLVEAEIELTLLDAPDGVYDYYLCQERLERYFAQEVS